jgi:hypothetical protein
MSIPYTQGKIQGKERKSVLQAVQAQAKIAARAAIRPVLQEFLEAEVCAKLGREKGVPRQMSGCLWFWLSYMRLMISDLGMHYVLS